MTKNKPLRDTIEQCVSIEIAGKQYTIDLEEIAGRLRIDPVHLDEELEEQASFYLWVALLAANAASDSEDEKQAFDIAYSELLSDVRRSQEEAGQKPTVSSVESEAKSSKEYTERLETVLTARRVSDILNVIKEAVRMRQYTLIERSRRASRDEAAEVENA